MRVARLAFAAALTLALLASLATAAAAWAETPPAPSNLRVLDGQETWHPDNDLRLDWNIPPNPKALAAVHYRVLDAGWATVGGGRLPFRLEIEHIHLPRPGRYWAQVWFESHSGELGASAQVQLLFDDARPAAVEPLLPTGWIGAEQQPLLRISQPAAPQPLSGIRGYAISLDSNPQGSPCLAATRCTEAETDLRGGRDSIPLEYLPEGTVYVHAVAVSGAGVSSSSVGTGVLHVDKTPPRVILEGAPGGWSSSPVTVRGLATDGLSGMSGKGGAITGLSVDGMVPASASGSSAQALIVDEGVHAISSFARDAAGNIGGGEGKMVMIDRTPPRVAFAVHRDPSDPESIEVRVADPLSGHDASRGTVAVRPRGSHRQFTPLPTAVSAGRLLARWDSDRAIPGQYEFRAIAYDAAGNAGRSQMRSNGTAMILAAPLKTATRLASGFGGRQLVWHRCSRTGLGRRCHREVVESFERRPAARTLPFGRRTTVGGILVGPRGVPLAGMPVQVIETFAGGPASRVSEVETEKDGSFATRLQPGPSRRIEFAFAGTRTLAAASGPTVALAVRAGVRLHASAVSAAVGGRPLFFRGAIADPATIPTGGKSVELQFRLPGLPWTQFRTVRSDDHGRFRYPYRFSDDDSRGVRFQFRAFAAAEEGWPYEPGSSPPIFVTAR